VSPDTNPEDIVTVACDKFSLSISETTTPEFNIVADAFSLYNKFPLAVITGASFEGVIVMVDVTGDELRSPSFTTHVIVLVVVGFSELVENVTERSAF
jgi:hypothetical protein